MSSIAVNTVPWAGGLSYGLLALPLAFVAMPLYMALPSHYAQNFAVPLGLLGLALLLARLADALCDPWIGRWVDQVLMRSRKRVLQGCLAASLVLVVSLYGLFFPWSESGPGLWWSFGISLSLTYWSWSWLSITHQAWATRLGSGDGLQARWVSWREGLALMGVMLASTLSAWAGCGMLVVLCAVALLAGLWGLARTPLSVLQPPAAQPTSAATSVSPWRSPAFRQLMAVFILNGMASAIPATLVLFFIRDRLQAPLWEPVFLGSYFASAALSMPWWVRQVGRRGLLSCWRVGMLMSVAAFAWTLGLQAGDHWAFLGICVASGAALGADLVVPAAALARVIQTQFPQGHQEGQSFGWWNFASKLNLALAAGVALPALQWWGYVPGSSQATSSITLSLAYGLLPCVLKLMAWALLIFFQRRALGSVLTLERLST